MSVSIPVSMSVGMVMAAVSMMIVVEVEVVMWRRTRRIWDHNAFTRRHMFMHWRPPSLRTIPWKARGDVPTCVLGTCSITPETGEA